MKKLIFISFLLIAISCENRPVKECPTFTEMADPQEPTGWDKVAEGMHVAFGSIDKRYPKSQAPTITNEPRKLKGWRGEKVSSQIVVWASEDLKQLECEVSDLKSDNSVIPASTIKTGFVRYVMTDIFAPGCGHRKPEDFPASLSADMIDNIECIDIEKNTVRPIWLSINIPESAKAGKYSATVTVFARDKKSVKLNLDLQVQNRVLPEPSKWLYYLDCWQHPSAVARVENLKPWSKEHYEALTPIMTRLANAGQKVITATLNKDPWNNQSFDKYEDMIKWTKNADETWTYDYTIFDEWINFMMKLGVKKVINCYSMVPWNNELCYTNDKGELITVKADPGTKIFTAMWTPFLTDFKKHLAEKGWLKITNIAMDERSPESMKATMKLLADVAPELGIALADNHKSYKQYPYIKDMCVGLEAKVDSADIARRKEAGLITTYYVCCAHEFPNMFTFSDPAEATYTAWHTAAAGFDGFLHWSYNSWVENPLTDSRYRTWPAGDTYMVYPNNRTSIRFERLHEGVQDFEKLNILMSEFQEKGELAKVNEIKTTLLKFNINEKPTDWQKMLHDGKMMIEKLSE